VTPVEAGVVVEGVSPSPPPHPDNKGMTESRRLVMMTVKRSGMRGVTLIWDKPYWCLTKSLMYCSIERTGYGYVDVDFGYFVREIWQEDHNWIGG